MNFTSIVATVQTKREELTTQADHLEASASVAAGSFSSLVVDDLNGEVRQVYDTQRQLERESQLLRAELAAFKHQLSSWSNTTQQLLEGLKHAGDLEHYVAVLSREAAALAKVLTAAAAADAQAEAAAAAATAVQTRGGSSTLVSGTVQGTACGGQDSAAGVAPPAAAAAALPAEAAAGTEEKAGELQPSTEEQLESPPELPVSKRASR